MGNYDFVFCAKSEKSCYRFHLQSVGSKAHFEIVGFNLDIFTLYCDCYVLYLIAEGGCIVDQQTVLLGSVF